MQVDIKAGELPEPRIKNRGAPKSEREVLEELQKKSFAEEIENDKNKSAVYINRAQIAESQKGKNDPIATQERMSGDVYKRALLLVGAGDLQIDSSSGETKNAAENNLPVSSYLSHGARVLIEVPAGSGNSLINWLSTGDKLKDGLSYTQSQQGAIEEGKIVYNRSAATHDVSIKSISDSGLPAVLREQQGFALGLRSFINNKLFGKNTKHFGVDLAMNAEFGGKDPAGKVIDRPDGDHGHLYIHYNPPQGDKPGSILIGIEGAAPSSSKHSKIGTSDSVSAIGSSKFAVLDKKKRCAYENEYSNTIIPKTIGGMVVKLDAGALKQIVEMDAQRYGPELAYAKPARSCDEFQRSLVAKDYHQTPEFAKTKALQGMTIYRPTILQKIINFVARGITLNRLKPYQKQINDYKESAQAEKVAQKIIEGDNARSAYSVKKHKPSPVIAPEDTPRIPRRGNSKEY